MPNPGGRAGGTNLKPFTNVPLNINICFMLQAGKRGTEAPDPAEQNGAATRTTDSANLLYPHPQRQCQV